MVAKKLTSKNVFVENPILNLVGISKILTLLKMASEMYVAPQIFSVGTRGGTRCVTRGGNNGVSRGGTNGGTRGGNNGSTVY